MLQSVAASEDSVSGRVLLYHLSGFLSIGLLSLDNATGCEMKLFCSTGR
jgi:hypothetical protein